MKKASVYIIFAISGALIGALLCLLSTRFLLTRRPSAPDPNKYVVSDSSGVTNVMLTDMAFEAAGYIKNGEYASLAKMVHPDGLYFSPYASANVDMNLLFSSDSVSRFAENTTVYTWGTQIYGGEPINMTVSDYFRRYVYNFDYTSSSLVGVNYTVRVGNARETVTTQFPDCPFVDLCFPGTPEAEYMDWSILRLVFKEYDGELRLAAIIHSEYTF